VSVLCVLAVWAIVGFVVLSPDVPASGDIGVKFVEAHSLIRSRFRSMTLLYPGAWMDPAGQFLPFRPPLIVSTPAGVQGIYPAFPAITQAVVIMLGGMRGLIGLSLLSSVVILWLTARIAKVRSEWVLPIALGIGTCTWFWAVAPWEHAPATAMTMAAFSVAFGRQRYAGVLAGLMLGVATGLRSESMLLLPGVLLALWLGAQRLLPLVGAVAGLAVVVLAVGVVEVQGYGRPVAAHIVHAVGFLRQAIDATGGATEAVPMLQPKSLGERYDIVMHYWLVSSVGRVSVMLFLAGAVAAWTIARRAWSSIGVLALALIALAWAAHTLWTLWLAPRWVVGLFGLSPFLVFALLPAPGLSACARRTRGAVVAASVAFVGIAILTTDTNGGKSLGGPRFLLPIVPLLTIAAWQAIVAYRDAGRESLVHRAIGWTGYALVTMSIVGGFLLLLPPFAQRNQGDHAAFEAIRLAPDRVLVATDDTTALLAAPALYFKKTVLLADNAELAHKLGSALQRAGVRSALVISRGGERSDIVLTPYRLETSEMYGRMAVQRWVR
jgi:hypothetical protein